MRSYLLPYIQLHTAIFLFGFTTILGNLITLDGVTLVAYRLALTLLSLAFFPGVWRGIQEMTRKDLLKIAGTGLLVALHWITFYSSIKAANSSIAVSCLSVTPFFTAMLEPLFFKTRIQPLQLVLGVVVVIGFGFIFHSDGEKYALGIILSLLSALFAASFSVLNKSFVDNHPTFSIMAIEFSAGLLMVLGFLPFLANLGMVKYWTPQVLDTWHNDWIWLPVLAWVCTTFAYTLSMKALKHVSAFTASLSINLEPIYGVVLAWYLFQENELLSTNFYIGTAIIVGAVFVHPVAEKYFSK